MGIDLNPLPDIDVDRIMDFVADLVGNVLIAAAGVGLVVLGVKRLFGL